MERGVRLGADVPYCIMRGTALSEGIGEILTPLPPMPQCRVLDCQTGGQRFDEACVRELKPAVSGRRGASGC